MRTVHVLASRSRAYGAAKPGAAPPARLSAAGLTVAAAVAAVLAVPALASARTAPASGQHRPLRPATAPYWQKVGPARIGGASHGASGGAGKLNAFAVDPADQRVMYTAGGVGPGNSGPGSDAGVFKSADGGRSWRNADAGLRDPAVGALWLDRARPATLLAGTWNTGIFRSVNSAASWKLVARLGATTAFVQQGRSLYAATARGVALSANSGRTWRLIKRTPSPVRALAGVRGTLWAGLDDGTVLKGVEPGNRWATVLRDGGHTVWSIAVPPRRGATAFVVEWDNYASHDLRATTDGGRKWSTVNLPGAPAVQVVAYGASPARLFAGSDGGLYGSADGGRTWRTRTGIEDVRYLSAWPGHPDWLVSAGDQGLYLSNDGGLRWKSRNGDITSSLLFGVSVAGREILASAQDYSPVVSYNGGATWSQVAGCEGGTVLINPGDHAYQYLLTTCGFAYSSDGGHTFKAVPALAGQYSGAGLNNQIAVDPRHPNVVYVAGTSGVWASSDWGARFRLRRTWPGHHRPAPPTLIVVTRGGTIYVGTTSRLFMSGDGGRRWRASAGLHAGNGNYPVTLAVDPARPAVVLAGMSGSPCCSGGIYRSTDGGRAFTPDNHGLPGLGQALTWGPPGPWQVVFQPRSKRPAAFEAGVATGIFSSSRAGTGRWAGQRHNAIPRLFTGLAWYGRYLYAATMGEGILRARIG